MSDTANAVESAVAVAKSSFARIDLDRLALFLGKVFRADVTITGTGAGSEQSGSSSGILVFTANIDRAGLRETKRLVLRYDPQTENRIFFEYDLKSQYDVLERLSGTGLPIPAVYGLDATGKDLGVAGFVMACIDGDTIPTSLFGSGLLVDASDDERNTLYLNILKALQSIHALDHVALGLGDFVKDAAGDTAQERLINWWWKTWDWAEPKDADRLVPIRQWLLANAPIEESPVLMHGDPNLGNYLLRDGEVSAILDWELSSIGSPELDLAIQVLSMEAHLPFAEHLPVIPPTQAEWLALYAQVGGRPLRHFEYFRVQAAYQIIICLGSMCTYLPDDVVAQYEAMAEFYWTIAETGVAGTGAPS
ncbi:phosphotransferase family protein [Hyphomonas johnsonii]|uniref:Aminoglycoside phosphotransferase n=1 Tax=Hyphomonas johnsonii MHS-2 TaxID=1280950 RepID=A0A059FNF6_9PROT|nr:phosphotransferase family protein [Hyphomonas johnsonii]KCZ92147.1 aminoglycoside phosphotransferase [Hyphomonas johnsonii MHS-2]